jgi:D-lactate dehydrogenase (cytochrome)|eukprot:COSAG01_NODE_18578_length_1066_cov_24.381593_3_plen_124_part_00
MLVVTADGKLIRTRQCTRKSSTGYDINQLYIGSEGTLGAIVELVVKIYPIMPVRVGCLVKFDQVADAARGVIGIVQRGPKSLCRCELLNADGIKATNHMSVRPRAPAAFHRLPPRGQPDTRRP